MRVIRKILRFRDIIDPLYGQRLYAHRTLDDKRNSISIVKCSSSMTQQIKDLWGRSNGWFDFYNTVGDSSKTHLYFPDDWFYDYVDAKLNNWRVCTALDDKSLYDFLFYDIDRPQTIATSHNWLWLNENHQLIDIQSVCEICECIGEVIIKPSVGSSGGRGIVFWKKGAGTIGDILVRYQNCVIQRIVEQHPSLSAIHPQSINSIRIMTMLFDGQVTVLSSVLRIGVGESRVDNVSSGGVAVGIDKDGLLRKKAFNAKGQSWDGTPDGLELTGRKVPSYDECCAISKRAAPRFSRFSKLISWDFAIDLRGRPLLIEANLYGGELDFHQMCNGPLFGDEVTTRAMVERFYKKRLLNR